MLRKLPNKRIGYSGAAAPPVRSDGATCFWPYRASDGFSPYTTLMDLSTDLSMYLKLILYELNDIRSMIASARGLSPSHIWLYLSFSLNCEQNMVDDFLRLLWIIFLRAKEKRIPKVYKNATNLEKTIPRYKKLLPDIPSGRSSSVYTMWISTMRHFPRPSFRWGVRLPPFRGIPVSR